MKPAQTGANSHKSQHYDVLFFMIYSEMEENIWIFSTKTHSSQFGWWLADSVMRTKTMLTLAANTET